MVNGEVLARTAILALKVITSHHVLPVQSNAFIRHVSVALQSDDAGLGERAAHRAQKYILHVGNNFRFIEKQQQECFVDGTKRECTVILIQNEYFRVHTNGWL